MRRFLKYLFSTLFLFCCLLLCSLKIQAAENINVYISVERFSIGQGYILSPTKVTLEKGTKASDLVEEILTRQGYEPDITTHTSYGWYLAGIKKADNGKSQVPVAVMNLDSYGYGLQYPTGRLPASENLMYPDLEQFSYQLEGMSTGWYYYVNNKAPDQGMAKYELEDQDVIRVQFTLCMGDLALMPDIDSTTKSLALIREYLQQKPADKEISSLCEKSSAIISDMDAEEETFLQLQVIVEQVALDLSDGVKNDSHAGDLEKIVNLYDRTQGHDVDCRINQLPKEITSENQGWFQEVVSMYQKLTSNQLKWVAPDNRKIFDKYLADAVTARINAIGTVTLAKESKVIDARKAYNALNPDAKAMVSSAALSRLKTAEQKIISLKKEQERKKYTPAKAKITKITSKKKLAKLTWKKIPSVSGYEIWMSAKKASGFKKVATIKKAATVTYTKKKLKSKKTMYFRVRAYRKVGKTTYYGAYSTVKKIKIK